MRVWLFEPEDLLDSPSRSSGVDIDTEKRYRKEGVKLILDVGSSLKLEPHITLATAAVYFHRFFMYHSFREFNRYITSLACLFLAGKVEETPKKCRDIVNSAREKFTDEQWLRLSKNHMEEVMSIERVLLQTIKFDLQVTHPYQYVTKYAKIFKIDPKKPKDRMDISKVVQTAWTFVNDSLCTELCLLWEPEVIAIALLHLASRFSKVQLNTWETKTGEKSEEWWSSLVENLDAAQIEAKDAAASAQQAANTVVSRASAAAHPSPHTATKVSPPNSSGSNSTTPVTPQTLKATPPVVQHASPVVYGSTQANLPPQRRVASFSSQPIRGPANTGAAPPPPPPIPGGQPRFAQASTTYHTTPPVVRIRPPTQIAPNSAPPMTQQPPRFPIRPTNQGQQQAQYGSFGMMPRTNAQPIVTPNPRYHHPYQDPRMSMPPNRH